ncbi:unnamed protein product [Prunus armeniaca]|uniref:Uncharacterized protein n=1 Tax=Prunus armeniaca TaxID=36596 RepID=A0A6J5XFJ2_PRUAR|nr:unnamed protein product [Prunus armeniaca]
MNELDDFNEDDLQKTQSINYTGHQKQEIGLEETEFEPNERPEGEGKGTDLVSQLAAYASHFAGIMSANTSTRERM